MKMRIRIWHCFIVFNCALIIPCLYGKPVSLNAIIAAEKENNPLSESESTPKSKVKGLVGKSVSLNALIAAENQKKHVSDSSPERKIKDNPKYEKNEVPRNKLIKTKGIQIKSTPRIKKLSTIRDRRSDIPNIKSFLKPQGLLEKLRKKRRNKSSKREILHNEDFDSNYFPLFGNLNKLLEKVLRKDASTASKFRKGKLNHSEIVTERNGMVCTCQQNSGLKKSAPRIKPRKKTVAHAKAISAEVSSDSEAAAAASPDFAVADIRSIGPNKNVPPVLSRNSLSGWGNNNGHSKRSSTAFHRDIKRNITRSYGNSQFDSRIREDESNTESYEEATHGFTRNSSSSHGLGRGDGNDTRNSNDRTKTNKVIEPEEIKTSNGGSSKEFDRKIAFKIGGNETGSEISVPEHVRGIRGQVSENQIGANTGALQSKEDHEKSNDNDALDRPNDKRVSDRSSPTSTETEDVSTEDITLISIKDLSNLTLALQSAPKGDVPVVTIFGGYSVAKDLNGQNKLSEQSIHIIS